jgi:5-methylcytosine-specific restriction enzyme B
MMMAIPNVDTLTLPVLQRISRCESKTTELVEAMARLFNLTDEERREHNPGKERPTKFENLVHFALNRLSSAKLINRLSPTSKEGVYEISERGRTEMLDPPEQITYRYLKDKYPDFLASGDNSNTPPKLDIVKMPAELGKFLTPPATTASIMPTMSRPTNLILHGPPGTGKTFSTAAEAVRLCDGALPEPGDAAAVRSRYRELVNAKQVYFVTFHQSYSYEDFVEGLRPTTREDDVATDTEATGVPPSTGGFRLEPVAGVFREIATLAEQARKAAGEGRRGNDFDLAGRRFWKMGLGVVGSDEHIYRAAIAGGYVALGWGQDVDWSDPRFASLEEMRKEWEKRYQGDKTLSQTSQPWVLRNKVQNGDLVIVPYGNSAFRAIAEVQGDYYFELSEDGTYNQRRKVRWLLTLNEPLPLDTIVEGNFTMRTLYEILEHRVRKEALIRLISKPQDGHEPTPPDQFVLIIDEINRADISKVFGELITLIEPDKRIGGDYELKARLPYSKVSFGVPDNLHIIGTMNTADRSIALLDTALRRRFAFRELMPRPELLGTVDGIQLDQLLTTINERIEYLFDREHQIGHAFFIRCQSRADVDDVMRRRVIPLLAEYFFDDWNKLAVVLGDADEREGGREGGFLDRRQLKVPTGLGGDGEAPPRYRWKVRDTFDYANLQ